MKKEYVLNIENLYKTPPFKIPQPYKTTYGRLGNDLYFSIIDDDEPTRNSFFSLGNKNLDFINRDCYKSDNFKQNTKNDILFVGCSETYIVGLDLEYNWTKKLHDKINKHLPFYNLGLMGVSSEEIIYNLFKYLYKYGNPGYIFMLLPEFHRGLNSNPDLSEFRIMQFYHLLELYCEANSIVLISSSHETSGISGDTRTVNTVMSDYFETFHRLDVDFLVKVSEEFVDKNISLKYLTKSRDGRHFGAAINHAISEFFFREYSDLTSKSEDDRL